MVAFVSVLALFLMLPFVISINETATQARMATQTLKTQTKNRYILESALEFLFAHRTLWRNAELPKGRQDLTMPLGGENYVISLHQVRQKMNDNHTKKGVIINLEALLRAADGKTIGILTAAINTVEAQPQPHASLLSYSCLSGSQSFSRSLGHFSH